MTHNSITCIVCARRGKWGDTSEEEYEITKFDISIPHYSFHYLRFARMYKIDLQKTLPGIVWINKCFRSRKKRNSMQVKMHAVTSLLDKKLYQSLGMYSKCNISL